MPFFDAITPEQRALIEASKLFFVASAAPGLEDGPEGEGPVNVSPKGSIALQVLDDRTVAYLDYKGSGNETIRHAEAGGAVTVMVIALDENAAIVRLYGRATSQPLEGSSLAERIEVPEVPLKPRQVVTIAVERTQTSCGYGVPVYEYVGDRTTEQRGRLYK
jgi:hypothetical protein